MGRSVTCTFRVCIQYKDSEAIYGAMSLKDARGVLQSEIEYMRKDWRTPPDRAIVWAQTARGRNLLKGYDYIEILANGRLNYKHIDTAIHQTTEQV